MSKANRANSKAMAHRFSELWADFLNDNKHSNSKLRNQQGKVTCFPWAGLYIEDDRGTEIFDWDDARVVGNELDHFLDKLIT